MVELDPDSLALFLKYLELGSFVEHAVRFTKK